MALPLTNTFEGGSNATNLIQAVGGNTGGGSGDYFDVVSPDNTADITFSSTEAAHGALSGRIVNTAAAARSMQWTTQLGTVSEVYLRLYLRIAANPTAAIRLCRFNLAGAHAGSVEITTTGGCRINNAAFSATITTTATVFTDRWNRIEARLQFLTANANVQIKLFDGDSDTPVTNGDTSSSTFVMLANADAAQIGQTTGNNSGQTFYLDDIKLDTTWPGPAVPPATDAPETLRMVRSSLRLA